MAKLFSLLVVVALFVGSDCFPDYYRRVELTSNNLQNLKRAREIRDADVGQEFDRIIDEMGELYGDLETYLDGNEVENSVLDNVNSWPANYTDISTKTFQVGNNVTVQKNTTIVKITIDNSTGVAVFTSTRLLNDHPVEGDNIEMKVRVDYNDGIDDDDDDDDDSYEDSDEDEDSSLSSMSSDWFDLGKEECFDDSECALNEFCDNEGYWFWPNECSECFGRDTLCNRNGECCPGFICVWGRCQSEVPIGETGTFCEMDNDCLEGRCCAFEADLGQVCKEMATEDMECSNAKDTFFANFIGVPPAECPCAPGLQCIPAASGFFSKSYCEKAPTTLGYNNIAANDINSVQNIPGSYGVNQPIIAIDPLRKLEEIKNELENFETEEELENAIETQEDEAQLPNLDQYTDLINENGNAIGEIDENVEDFNGGIPQFAENEEKTWEEVGNEDLTKWVENYEKNFFQDGDEYAENENEEIANEAEVALPEDDVGAEYLGGEDEADDEWFEDAKNNDGFQLPNTDALLNDYLENENEDITNEGEVQYPDNDVGAEYLGGEDEAGEEWFEEAKNDDGFQLPNTEAINEYTENKEIEDKNDEYQNELVNLIDEKTEMEDNAWFEENGFGGEFNLPAADELAGNLDIEKGETSFENIDNYQSEPYDLNNEEGDDNDDNEFFMDDKVADVIENNVNEYEENEEADIENNAGAPSQDGLPDAIQSLPVFGAPSQDGAQQLPVVQSDMATNVDDTKTYVETPGLAVDQNGHYDLTDKNYLFQGPYRTDDDVPNDDVIEDVNFAREQDEIFM